MSSAALLQTEALCPEQIERLVALRMQRREVILRADPLQLWVIPDEAVIRRTMGVPELMREQQLSHLGRR